MRVFDKVFQRAGTPLRVVADRLGDGHFRVAVGDESYEVSALRKPDGGVRLVLDGQACNAYGATAGKFLQIRAQGWSWTLEYDRGRTPEHQQNDGIIEAPMTGTVTVVLVQPGDTVSAGQQLVLLTAMKMEHALQATTSGVVTEVNVEDGQSVEQGTVLIRIARSPDLEP